MVFRQQTGEFFSSFRKSMIPHKYRFLITKNKADALSYFMTLMSLSIILMMFISIPFLFILHDRLVTQFHSFKKLKFSYDVQVSDPIVIGIRTPQIIIDTTGKYTKLEQGSLLITDKIIDYKILGLTNRIYLSDFNDLTKKQTSVVSSVLFLLVLLLPSLLIWLFVAQFIKYILIVLAVALIGKAFAQMMKYEINFAQSLIVAVYASTLMVLLDTILLPFNLGKYVLQFPIFLNYGISLLTIFIYLTVYIISLVMVGNKEYVN